MAVVWVYCCGRKIFTVALGTNFYGEKVKIFHCSEMAVSKGNKRFLASPETFISFSNCLYYCNKYNRNID